MTTRVPDAASDIIPFTCITQVVSAAIDSIVFQGLSLTKVASSYYWEFELCFYIG